MCEPPSAPAPTPSAASAGPPEPDIQQRLRRGLTIVTLSLLVPVLLYIILLELVSILRPLFIAIFLCYLILPIHRWLLRRGVPSAIAYLLVGLGFSAVLYLVGALTYYGFSRMAADLPAQLSRLEETTDRLQAWLQDALARFEPEQRVPPTTERFAETGPTATWRSTPPSTAPGRTRPSGPPAGGAGPWHILSPGQLLGWANAVIGTFFSFLLAGLVVLLYLLFLLAELRSIQERLRGAFRPARVDRIQEALREINSAVRRYMGVKAFTSLIISVFSGIVLLLYGVHYYYLWAILIFIGNFVPYIGSVVTMGVPVMMAAFQFNDWLRPISIGVIFLVADTLVANVLEPALLGRRLGVSPLVVLLSLAFWGLLWGVPGMILSAPLAVTIRIVLERFSATQPLARLISSS